MLFHRDLELVIRYDGRAGPDPEAMQFPSSLEFTLREGLAQEKLVALRRCIEKISINKPDGTVKLTLRSVPVGNLEGAEECHISL